MKFSTYLFPILTALLLLVVFLYLPNLKTCTLPGRPPSPAPRRKGKSAVPPLPEADRSTRLTRRDAIPMLIITLVYALTAFFRLGSTVAPQTFVPMGGQTAEIQLPEGAFPRRILLYAGVDRGSYDIAYSEDGESYRSVAQFEQNHVAVLKWAELTPTAELTPRFVRVTYLSGTPWLGELVFLDAEGAVIPAQSSLPALCDEPETAPEASNFLNSSYFDEIYHARTAWEHRNGVWPYEVTHPPLGKEIIGLGIGLFGMTPFGWRFSGTLFGVLMLPLLYVFLKKLFGGRTVPTLGTLVMATDFMHYAQTRIATIDTYSVFFILLMYLFLYLWLSEDKLWALALCGVSFGLGAAAKWTSIYAGVGLALLWAAHWLLRYLQTRQSATARRGDPCGRPQTDAPVGAAISRPQTDANAEFFIPFLKNVGFCLIFFVAVPALIYYLSYLPYGAAKGVGLFSRDYWQLVVDNQISMFQYHSEGVLGATHPYSSHWYQWLLDIRPILYVLEYPSETTKISIAAFLNPVLCWGGLISLPVLGWMAIGRRDRRAAFLLVGYLSQILPWVGIERLTFAYHYFPSSLFLVLCLSYVMALLRENRPGWKTAAWCLTAGSAALFVLFFPALNGLAIDRQLGSALMRWFSTWPL